MKDEALKLLDALKVKYSDVIYATSPSLAAQFENDLAGIEQALAAPVQPVGEVSGHDWSTGLLYRDLEPGTRLYTTPPAAQRQWVGLTDKQINNAWFLNGGGLAANRFHDFARAIESKLKEKNNG